MKIKSKINNFVLFDGVKSFTASDFYDNWLSSLDFTAYSKSFIEFSGNKVLLFQNREQELSTFQSSFSFIDIENIANEFGMKIKIKNDVSYCVVKGHEFDSFYAIQYNSTSPYYIIFGVGGSKDIDSLYIHGIWELDS
jgi:hypothetical protein